MATTPENPRLTAILDKVHEVKPYSGFVDLFAEHMAIENMGHDPAETSFAYFNEEASAAHEMAREKADWVRAAKVLVKDLQAKGAPLTIRAGIAAFEADRKKYTALYAGKKK